MTLAHQEQYDRAHQGDVHTSNYSEALVFLGQEAAKAASRRPGLLLILT